MILVFSTYKPDFTCRCGQDCLALQHQINRINAMMEQTNNSTDTLLASFQAGNMAAFFHSCITCTSTSFLITD